ncbi:hypothetical protein Tco_1351839 [Tanacetum coccineum]
MRTRRFCTGSEASAREDSLKCLVLFRAEITAQQQTQRETNLMVWAPQISHTHLSVLVEDRTSVVVKVFKCAMLKSKYAFVVASSTVVFHYDKLRELFDELLCILHHLGLFDPHKFLDEKKKVDHRRLEVYYKEKSPWYISFGSKTFSVRVVSRRERYDRTSRSALNTCKHSAFSVVVILLNSGESVNLLDLGEGNGYSVEKCLENENVNPRDHESTPP